MVRYLRSNALALLALIVALGGTSYAAVTLQRNSVTSREIAEDAVGASELAKGAAGIIQEPTLIQDEQKSELVLDGGTPHIALSADYDYKGVGNKMTGDAFVTALLEITNTADQKGSPAVVQFQVLENGDPEGPAFTTTVPDGATMTAPVSILCNAMPPGVYTMSVEAIELSGAEGVSLNDRVLDIVAFGPIFHPPR
jgi:hypothetical protein